MQGLGRLVDQRETELRKTMAEIVKGCPKVQQQKQTLRRHRMLTQGNNRYVSKVEETSLDRLLSSEPANDLERFRKMLAQELHTMKD
jgi:hypothetical protein